MIRRKILLSMLSAGVITQLPSKWLKPVVASVLLPAHAQTSNAVTFDRPTRAARFNVPEGITTLRVTVYGAKGGDGGQGFSTSSISRGGAGGLTEGTIDVVPDERLIVVVGGKGGDGTLGQGGGGYSGVLRPFQNSQDPTAGRPLSRLEGGAVAVVVVGDIPRLLFQSFV